MNSKKRNILLIILGIAGIFSLAMMEVVEKGSLSFGFAGISLLIIGSIIIPSGLELRKEHRKK